MDETVYRRLTPRQLECLRLVARDRSASEIAQILELSPETVVSHLKKAGRTIGNTSRFNCARMLAEYERRPHPMVITTAGGSTEQSEEGRGPPSATDKQPTSDQVREERAAFTAEPFAVAFAETKDKANNEKWLNRLVLALALTTLIFMIFDRSRELGDAFQGIANVIKSPHR